MSTTKWPHKMSGGIFKGRTFASQADYQQALAEFHVRGQSTNGTHVDTKKVSDIVDAYEILLAEGISRTKAKVVISKLIGD